MLKQPEYTSGRRERDARAIRVRRAISKRPVRHRGQTLVIFALSATVLIALAGLAIDSARAVDLYARMQRAAEAGALAGVLYVPSYYNTVRPGDTESAISRASEEVVKNGFGSVLATNASVCPVQVSTIEVAVCQVTGKQDDLEVSITEHFDLVLLSALGVTPITLTASGQAEYLPPVQLGARLNYFGDQVECSSQNPPIATGTHSCSTDANDNHLQYFMATMKGPATLKEQGDPMVYCEEGPSEIGGTDGVANSFTTYDNVSTNHPQYTDAITKHCGVPGTGGNPGNPDQQPSGFSGPATANTAHPGGYNYQVVVPAGVSGASLWVYNPSFVAGLGAFNGNESIDRYPSTHTATGGNVAAWNTHYDAPSFYFSTTYTLYSVASYYDRSADSEITSVTYPPYDGYGSDLNLHGCFGSNMVYDPYWEDYQSGGTSTSPNSYYQAGSIVPGQGCLDLSTNTAPSWNPSAPAPCYLQWCTIATNLAPGIYRFVAEGAGLITNTPAYTSTTTDGSGTHLYAVKVCSTSGISSPLGCSDGSSGSNPGVSVFGWNNMEVAFSTNVGHQTPDTTNPATSCVTSSTTGYTCLDLGCIPTAYAGRAMNIRLFDPGDGSGDIYIGVVAPAGSGATITYPSWVPTSTIDGDTVVHAHFNNPFYNAFNGTWLDATVSLPATYTGNCLLGNGGTGWFQLAYASANGTPNDWVNASFTLVGSPLHLVAPSLG